MNAGTLNANTVVFLHIPKTAGSSFTKIIKSLYPSDQIYHQMESNTLIAHLQQRQNREKLYIGHYYFDVLRYFAEPPTVLTFLREPRNRVLSHYYFYKAQSEKSVALLPWWDQHIVELTRKHSFANFISLDLPEIDKAFSNLQTRHIASSTDFDPPRSAKETTELLNLAISHLRDMAFVGIVERFEESLEIFRYQFGLEAEIRPLAVNVNKARPGDNSEVSVFDHNPVAQRRIALDQKLYQEAMARLTAAVNQMPATATQPEPPKSEGFISRLWRRFK